ncbi:MAG: hypothetical protein LBU69_06090 [Deltaproteobacteria bacterium]|jgi:hypothetical protein|nr:hypothetical protein [Deltaproteobacteria bacterium]
MAKLGRAQLFQAASKAFPRDVKRKHEGLREIVGLAISAKDLPDDKNAKAEACPVPISGDKAQLAYGQ